jgi:hypothetical protein
MRTLKLKETDSDIFLRLENAPKGGLIVMEKDGEIVSQMLLNIKQLGHIRDWMGSQLNDIVTRNKVSSKNK